MKRIYFLIICFVLKTFSAHALGDATQGCISYLHATYANILIAASPAPVIVDSESSPGYTRVIVPLVLFLTADGVPYAQLGVSACTSEFANGSLPKGLDQMSARDYLNSIGRACGSEIDYENKFVSESIPIDGTDIYLNYSSRYNAKINKNRTVDIDYRLNGMPIASLKAQIRPANATEDIPINLIPYDSNRTKFIYTTSGAGLTYSNAFKTIYDFSVSILKQMDGGASFPMCTRDLDGTIVCSYLVNSSFFNIVNEQKTLVLYKPAAFGLKGWTVSKHHFFDRVSKTLFLGSGDTLPYKSYKTITLAPYGAVDVLINQMDPSELFIFNQQGVHLETRHALMKTLISKFNYLENGNLSSIENIYGQTTNFHYNGLGNIERITSNYGVQTLIDADNLKINSATDSLGHFFEMQYDANDLLTTFKNVNGVITTFSYDGDGNFLKEEKNNGLTQTFYTDFVSGVKYYVYKLGFGDLGGVATDIVDDKIITSKYNGSKDVVYYKETQILNNSYKTVAEEFSSEDFYGADSMWGQDFSGTKSTNNIIITPDESIVSSISRQDSRFYQNSTDPLTLEEVATLVSEPIVNRNIVGSLTFSPVMKYIETDSVRGPTVTTFNAQGLPTKIEPLQQYPTNLEYDSFGRLSKIKKGNQEQAFAYDANGYLSSSTDYKNHTTQYLRNKQGQVLEVILPNSDTIKYEYDAGGTLKKLTTPSNQVHLFHVGLGDYIEGLLTPSGKRTVIEYDIDKRVDKVTKPSGKILDYVYKPAAKDLEKIVTPEGELKVTNYDVLSRVRSITSTDNINLDIDWAGGAVKKQTWYDADGSTIASLKATYYSNQFRVKDIYLNSSKIATYTYFKGRVDGLETDVYSQYSYPVAYYEDNVNVVTGNRVFFSQSRIDSALGANPTDLTKVTVNNSSNAELELSMKRVYDTMGQASEFTSLTYNINSHVYSNYFSLVPEYDQNNRLIKMEKIRKTYVNGVLADSTDFYNKYLYPPNSNNNMKEFTQLQSLTGPAIKRTVASHNNDDQLLALKGSINRTYTYTADGEMESMTNCFGTTNYDYDSFSNLKKVTFPDGKIIQYKVDGMNRRVKKLVNGMVKEYYLWYDQQRLAAVLDENKAPKAIYLYGPESGHSPSYVIKNNKTYKVVNDAGTGSVRYIVDPANAYVVQELEYDEFGNIMRNTSPGFQSVLFAGGLYDEDTKLMRFGARDYDPTIGRWTTKDPIGFAGGDANLYAYVGGDPMSYIDPAGLWGIGVIGGGSAEGGAGNVGGGATGSAGAGLFCGGKEGVNAGAFAGGGTFFGGSGVPSGGSNNMAVGGFAGVGGGLFFTNATSVGQLGGQSNTYSFNLGVGPFKFSAQLSSGGGIWMGSITLGPGIGVSGSTYPTYTGTTGKK